MSPDVAASVVVALLGGGALGGLLDRWRYRRRPALDIVGLAQQIAQTALAQAHTELGDAYRDAATARHEAAAAYAEARSAQVDARAAREELFVVRDELAACRGEIQRLVAMLAAAGVHT